MYYFAYASNLNRKQMTERCPDSKPIFTATLPNYKLVFVGYSRKWRGGVATIKSSRGDKVKGAIYEVTEKCVKQLDKFEGYPSDYNKINVTVFDEDGTPVEALTYIKAGRLDEDRPSQEYLVIIQQGYKDWRLV